MRALVLGGASDSLSLAAPRQVSQGPGPVSGAPGLSLSSPTFEIAVFKVTSCLVRACLYV